MSQRRGEPAHYRLEVAAQLVQLPPTQVRRCIRLGLIQPSRIEGRALLFGEDDLARLRKIRRLRKELGLNMAGVEVTLRLLDEIESLRSALRGGP